MTMAVATVTIPDDDLMLEKVSRILWVANDPIVRQRIREICLRWRDVRQLLSKPYSRTEITHKDSENHEPQGKRQRSSSEDSIVVPKAVVQLKKAKTPESVEVLPTTEWECKKCTFMNPPEAITSCQICGWFKPRSEEATGLTVKGSSRKESPVEAFIISRADEQETHAIPTKKDDQYAEILSRSIAGLREHRLTGIPSSSSLPSNCTIYTSSYNLLACGQAQEESAWMNALEKDVFAQHGLDEEVVFVRRWLAAKSVCHELEVAESRKMSSVSSPASLTESRSFSSEEIAAFEKQSALEYSLNCNAIIGHSFPAGSPLEGPEELSWKDWQDSGVHTAEFLERLALIHSQLVKETIAHYSSVKDLLLSSTDICSLLADEQIGRRFVDLFLSEPKCDLSLHCLSHVEGDNVIDRFLLPASMERANLIFSALGAVWNNPRATGFIAARPPGHHCPSFEDRLIGLSAASSESHPGAPGSCSDAPRTKLEKQLCKANGLTEPPREHGMGFCALNGLAVAIQRFLHRFNPGFERMHNRSIRVAILDLDIHAGNGTELVFRDNRSVLHVSVHRYGWLKANLPDGDNIAERVMPGTHYYRDVGGVFGKLQKRPKGEGYSVNITLRKGDGNAEVLSAFEGVGLPIMQEFEPDIVVVACGFDGLKLSPVFKRRWGEESCPGMDAEYTPSLYGYIVNRVREEVQTRVVAATEGGYDPVSVGLAARSVVRGLNGAPIPKPPMRIFNSDWLPQLNNIFQLQQLFWSSLTQ